MHGLHRVQAGPCVFAHTGRAVRELWASRLVEQLLERHRVRARVQTRIHEAVHAESTLPAVLAMPERLSARPSTSQLLRLCRMLPSQATALRIHIAVRVEVREIPHPSPGRRNRDAAMHLQCRLDDQCPRPPCSQTVQRFVHQRTEAHGRSAVRGLCSALRTQPKSTQY